LSAQTKIQREGASIEGKYETDVFMSILDREYESLKENFIEIFLLN
jgi:[ribosomal protein S5]-alanine N-acetyltransferase